MDLNKLTTSDKVIGGSAITLFIFSFFPWFGKGGYSRNGWSYILFGVLPVLLALAMLAVVIIKNFTTTKLPDLPVTWAQANLIAGGLTAVLILLKLIIGDKYKAGISGLGNFSVDLDRQFGIFLALLAAIGLVVGAYLKMQEPADNSGPPPAI